MKARLSFRWKMLLMFIVLVVISTGGTWFVFRVFIDKYSQVQKVKEMENCFRTVNEAFGKMPEIDESKMSLEFANKTANHYSIMIINLEAHGKQALYTNESNSNLRLRYQLAVRYYMGFGQDKELEQSTILKEHNNYRIYKLKDNSIDTENLDVFGRLDNGWYLLVRANYILTEEDNQMAMDLLMVSGLCSLVVGIVCAAFLSRRVTKPIKQMSLQSEKMAQMDFDVRCDVKSGDEIGVLGQSLNRLAGELQKTVGELKNANNELLKDLEKRNENDRMRSEFIANVSHELKTPIALIQGYAEGLAENISDDEESRTYYCEVIADEAAKMSTMVQKLLKLNQLEFGNNQLDIDRFDIMALLRGVLESTAVLREQSGITLHFAETEPIYVWADEYMIEEVITNYVSNAIHYATKEKEIAVSVKKNDASLRVSVYNTGEPIPEEAREQIWTKFYKVDKARTREYGGSGIGLSIVKAIMEQHNRGYGFINHVNGVEFWFELELAGQTE